MRNLKKVLSLGMAFLMVFGLFSVASARTFSDVNNKTCSDNEINAIDVLSEIGILKGTNSAGTIFNPEGLVDRATFAKLLYVAANGGKDDGGFRYMEETSPFADVSTTNWAYGYCVWAYRTGMISGRSVTADNLRVYAPKDNVSLIEAVKLILCMLGYDKNQLNFEGTGWSTNVVKYGNEAGLFIEDFDEVPNGEYLTRAQAALLLLTGFGAKTVDVINNVVIKGESTFAYEKMGLEKVSGIVVANDALQLVKGTGYAEGDTVLFVADEAGRSYFEDEDNTGYFISLTDIVSGVDFIGRDAYVYAKIDDNGNISKFYSSAIQLTAGYTVEESYNYELNEDNTAVPAYVNFSRLATDLNAAKECGTADSKLYVAYNNADGGGTGAFTTPYTNIRYIVDADGVVVRAFADQWFYGTVTKKTAATDTKPSELTIKIASIVDPVVYKGTEGYDDVAVDDLVFVQGIKTAGDTVINKVVEAETIKGTITANNRSYAKITFGGTSYVFSGYVGAAKTVGDMAALSGTKNFVLDLDGKIIDWTDVEIDPQNVALLLSTQEAQAYDVSTGNLTTVYYARMITDQNKTSNMAIASINGVEAKDTDADFIAEFEAFEASVETVWSYEISGNKWIINDYSLTAAKIDAEIDVADLVYSTGTANRITAAGVTYVLNSQSRVFVEVNDTWTYSTGAFSFSFENGEGTLYKDKIDSAFDHINLLVVREYDKTSASSVGTPMIRLHYDNLWENPSAGVFLAEILLFNIDAGAAETYFLKETSVERATNASKAMNLSLYNIVVDEDKNITTKDPITVKQTVADMGGDDLWFRGNVTATVENIILFVDKNGAQTMLSLSDKVEIFSVSYGAPTALKLADLPLSKGVKNYLIRFDEDGNVDLIVYAIADGGSAGLTVTGD